MTDPIFGLTSDLMPDPDLPGEIWRALHQATQDRTHAWRTPVLATVGPDGSPQARTVVLRKAEQSSATLQIYTDRRSPKVAQLADRPDALLVFWSPALSWQLRVRTVFRADTHSEVMRNAWEQVRHTSAARDYLTAAAPGEPPSDAPMRAPDAQQLAVLIGTVVSIDWLELGRTAHRRAVFDHGGTRWLTP